MKLLDRLLGRRPVSIEAKVSHTLLSDTPNQIYMMLMDMLLTRPVNDDAIGPIEVRNKVADAYAHLLAAQQLLREWREADRRA
jgi:hypothetical protein